MPNGDLPHALRSDPIQKAIKENEALIEQIKDNQKRSLAQDKKDRFQNLVSRIDLIDTDRLNTKAKEALPQLHEELKNVYAELAELALIYRDEIEKLHTELAILRKAQSEEHLELISLNRTRSDEFRMIVSLLQAILIDHGIRLPRELREWNEIEQRAKIAHAAQVKPEN